MARVERGEKVRRRWLAVALVFVGLLGLGGCAKRPQTLYYWGDYQGQVYAYLQHAEAGAVAKQLVVLEKDEQKAKAENRALSPGYHAHLGLLYFRQGQVEKAAEQFEIEKTNFPESAIFMDRMLAKFKQ
jgi:hypothetical protein